MVCRVPRLPVGVHLHLLGLEAGSGELLGKGPVSAGRPHRQYAARPQGAGAGIEAIQRIEPAVALLRQALGAVVDIQHDRIEALWLSPEQLGNILVQYPGAGIAQRMAGLLAERAAVPFDDPRHQLGDQYLGVRAQLAQG